MAKVFSWGIKRAKILQNSLPLILKEYFYCGDKKERLLKARLVDRMDHHLDMRNIVKNQVTLLTLVKRIMSP